MFYYWFYHQAAVGYSSNKWSKYSQMWMDLFYLFGIKTYQISGEFHEDI